LISRPFVKICENVTGDRDRDSSHNGPRFSGHTTSDFISYARRFLGLPCLSPNHCFNYPGAYGTHRKTKKKEENQDRFEESPAEGKGQLSATSGQTKRVQLMEGRLTCMRLFIVHSKKIGLFGRCP
jgi:hypothetical protein